MNRQYIELRFDSRWCQIFSSEIPVRGVCAAPRHVAKLLRTALLAALCAGCGSHNDVAEHPGKAVYQRYCYACHQAGIADAPKFGDKEAWRPRLTKSRDELVDSVKNGMAPGMPPRAGCSNCSDEELEAAVDFMVLRVQ